MKTIISLLLSLVLFKAGAQGRVVINEYMPWTGNDCNATSEFIELLNFGPGPVNIGCYVITDGDFAITIPANTILQPGQFYVISGQSTIPMGCANLDSATTVHLNWNTCTNCVSAPIPTTGDGLFTDGGPASEQLVLLDANLQVVDAVVRDVSLIEPSSSITTAAGVCGARTFDLDLMTINYEMIGESAGRANSFARMVDGDCEWVKDSRQSANASNNTTGESTSINYNLIYVRTRDCDGQGGAVNIEVSASNVAAAFPITYTLVYDADQNLVFDLSDQYTTGTDNTAPYVEFTDLPAGRYRISVGSTLGCNLRTFEFDILNCTSVLPVQLLIFRHTGTSSQSQHFTFRLEDASQVKEAVLEQSIDGKQYTDAARVSPAQTAVGMQDIVMSTAKSASRFFRLRLHTVNDVVFYGPTISLQTGVDLTSGTRAWPNPAETVLQLQLPAGQRGMLPYQVYGTDGRVAQQGTTQADTLTSRVTLPVGKLKPGIYHLVLGQVTAQPIRVQFVKR